MKILTTSYRSTFRENEYYAKVAELNGNFTPKKLVYFQLLRENQFIMITYDFDFSATPARLLNSKSTIDRLKSVQNEHECVSTRFIHLETHFIDNEFSKAVKYCTKTKIK